MHQIEVNGLKVDVVRKNIKNLHLAVYPPNGRVRVAAPLRVNDEAVRLAVISKMPWIKRQQTKFQEQEGEAKSEYVNGESHYFQGTRYRLNVIVRDAPPIVILRNKEFIDLYVRPNGDTSQRERVMSVWYRGYLKQTVPPLIEKWEKMMGVEVAELGIKKMKTKWGSCNIKARRIWLNLELAKKSAGCLEYVLVHEMTHLLERRHNRRFRELMNKLIPQWRQYRDELHRAHLRRV